MPSRRPATGIAVACSIALLGTTAAGPAQAAVTQSFRSAPGLHPPRLAVGRDPDPGAGDIFLTPAHTQEGPMILDPRGRLIWFHPIRNGVVLNLEKQPYLGHPVLTWWQENYVHHQASHQEDVIVDSSYRTVAVLHASSGYTLDAHEFQITPQNRALIDAVAPVSTANGVVDDDVVEELDISTGQVMWQWHSLQHVSVTASYEPVTSGSPYDYFHLNSVQQLPGGNVLISARNTWAIYDVNPRTGKIVWTLGGKDSSFQMEPGSGFEWQHDARLTGGTLTLFDDAADGSVSEEPQSSAESLSLDLGSMTATLLHRYVHNPPVLAGAQGSTQLLPDGNVFVGWGSQPYFSEYTPSGTQIFDGKFPTGVSSYRAFRFPWSGQPLTAPALALAPQPGGHTRVYASWNGATDVAAWRVLGGSRRSALRRLARATRTGFQTTINVSSRARYFAVQALDSHGRVLGTSATRGPMSGGVGVTSGR
jgi:hypothetical protein